MGNSSNINVNNNNELTNLKDLQIEKLKKRVNIDGEVFDVEDEDSELELNNDKDINENRVKEDKSYQEVQNSYIIELRKVKKVLKDIIIKKSNLAIENKILKIEIDNKNNKELSNVNFNENNDKVISFSDIKDKQIQELRILIEKKDEEIANLKEINSKGKDFYLEEIKAKENNENSNFSIIK